jgi:hypothetical protein
MRITYLVLVIGVLVGSGCTGDSQPPAATPTGAPGGAPQQQLSQEQLSGRNYKIANGSELASNIAVPTVKSAGKTAGQFKDMGPSAGDSGGGESSLKAANVPESVVFNSDGTFKMTYSDASYFVGGWKIVDGKLVLSIAGDSAIFDTKFPSADTIALLLQKATSGSSGGASSGGAVDINVSMIEPKQGDAKVTDFLAKTKGTWCYEDGNKNEKDDAIASFTQLGESNIHVLFFSGGSDYEAANLIGIHPDASFELSYYHPQSTLSPKFSVKDDTMTIAYAPLKKTVLKRISTEEAECKFSQPVQAPKTPLVLWLCIDESKFGHAGAQIDDKQKYLYASPNAKDRFVIYLSGNTDVSVQKAKSPWLNEYSNTSNNLLIMGMSPPAQVCAESSNKPGVMYPFQSLTIWNITHIDDLPILQDANCGDIPNETLLLEDADLYKKHDVVIIYPVGSKTPPIDKTKVPPPACQKQE